MKKYQSFGEFWDAYFDKPVKDRGTYFSSLSKEEQTELVDSLFVEGWDKLIVHNIIDYRLDYIKEKFGIDILDMRIKCLKYNKSFSIDISVWNVIYTSLTEFDEMYDTNLLFGGLDISSSGNKISIQKRGVNV